jgi:hypothetical protein
MLHRDGSRRQGTRLRVFEEEFGGRTVARLLTREESPARCSQHRQATRPVATAAELRDAKRAHVQPGDC